MKGNLQVQQMVIILPRNFSAANVTSETFKEEIHCMMIGEMRYPKNVWEEQQWMPSG
jgi:hypothetical protein